jgi:hypothetical protein
MGTHLVYIARDEGSRHAAVDVGADRDRRCLAVDRAVPRCHSRIAQVGRWRRRQKARLGVATAGPSPRVLAVATVDAERDPASPTFDADEPRVVSTPFGRIAEDHPLRRALGRIDFPTSAERVLSAVRDAPDVDEEQARWLEGLLRHRVFSDADEVVASLGTWGLSAPGASPSL